MSTLFFALVFVITNAQQFGTIDDLALIWVGSRHRPDWNKELFTQYLVHEYPDGHKSWLFDGFLMIDEADIESHGPVELFYQEDTDARRA